MKGDIVLCKWLASLTQTLIFICEFVKGKHLAIKATDPQKQFDQWRHERKSIQQLKGIRLSKHVSKSNK